jgi:heterodisulfide reductase subunit C
VIRGFFRRTGQPLLQDWLVEMGRRLLRHLPVKMLFAMGLQGMLRPRTRGWGPARAAIEEYVAERESANRRALGLNGAREAGE